MFALAAIATAAFVVFWDTRPESFLRPKAAPLASLPKADSYMTATATRKFDQRGEQSVLLTAAGSQYFQSADRLTMDRPRVVVAHGATPGPPWHVEAASSEVFAGGKRIVLRGDVHAWRDLDTRTPQRANAGQATARRPPPTTSGADAMPGKDEIKTSLLILYPDDQRAETDRKVVLSRLANTTAATGLKADFRRQTYQLLSKVRSVYEAP